MNQLISMHPLFTKDWASKKKDTDEGALILLSLDSRKVRIEVVDGAEGYLNDAKAGRIRRAYGVPCFKDGQLIQMIIEKGRGLKPPPTDFITLYPASLLLSKQ